MKPIFLLGYMGSGKTTLGKPLATEMKCEFIDIDIYIEARYHRTISQLFQDKGEDGFREIEKSILEELCDFEDVLVSCGGGTPCFFDNMDLMNKYGFTIYLQTSIDELVERLKIPHAKAKRPVLADKNDEELREFISKMVSDREKWYKKAHITFDSSTLDNIAEINESAKQLASRLKDRI